MSKKNDNPGLWEKSRVWWRKLGRQKEAWHYRIFAAIPLVASFLITMYMIYKGPDWHVGRGTPPTTEYRSEMFTAFLTYLPMFPLVWAWFSYNGFKLIRKDKIYLWQAILTLVIAYLTAAFSLYELRDILVNKHYTKLDVNGIDELMDVSMALSSRLGWYFTVTSIFWYFTLALGLFHTEPQTPEPSKPRRKPASKPTSEERIES